MMRPNTTKRTTKRAPAKPRNPATDKVTVDKAAKEPRDNPGTGHEGSAPERAPEADIGQDPPAVVDAAAPKDESAASAGETDFDPTLDGGDDAGEIFGDDDEDSKKAEPDADPAAEKTDEPSLDPAKLEAAPDEPASKQDQSSAGIEKVQLGAVEGVLHFVPLGVVKTVVGPESTNHAAALRNAVVSDLMKRWRVSDGRYAPMIFTHDGDESAPAMLFAGLETMAAAMALEKDTVPVVIITTGDAKRAQGAIAARMHRPKSTDDDDLMWRQRD